MHLAILLSSSLAVLSPAVPAESKPVAWKADARGVRVASGVTYATAGGEELKLDLALPKGDGPHPVVVCFHGGAWRMGSRNDLSSLVRDLAASGYAAATVSYRLAPRHKFPAQIEDAKTAVRFLRARANDLHLDPENVAALGFSAGGHLAALLATTDTTHGFDGPLYADQSSRVRCVVDYFGPKDLALYAAAEGVVDAYMAPFLGKECKLNPAVYRKASPLEYVSKTCCPMLVFHGTADVVVPVIHSEQFCEKCQKVGAPVELVVLKGEGHGFGWEAYQDSSRKTVRFLDQHLKGKK